jgi:hypothetical protein
MMLIFELSEVGVDAWFGVLKNQVIDGNFLIVELNVRKNVVTIVIVIINH